MHHISLKLTIHIYKNFYLYTKIDLNHTYINHQHETWDVRHENDDWKPHFEIWGTAKSEQFRKWWFYVFWASSSLVALEYVSITLRPHLCLSSNYFSCICTLKPTHLSNLQFDENLPIFFLFYIYFVHDDWRIWLIALIFFLVCKLRSTEPKLKYSNEIRWYWL